MRSQNFTYAMEIRKKAIVAATKITSRMSIFSSQSELARAIAGFRRGIRLRARPSKHDDVRALRCATPAGAAGIRGESRRNPEDSQRNVSSRINGGPSVTGWLASSIGCVMYSLGANRMHDSYLVFLAGQRDKKADQEPDPQSAHHQRGKDRGTCNYVRLKHCALSPHWIVWGVIFV